MLNISVIVDSVPDLAQIDQLMFVSCFVSVDSRVTERFLRFELIHSHTGISISFLNISIRVCDRLIS